jgi:hypothetical protein
MDTPFVWNQYRGFFFGRTLLAGAELGVRFRAWR